MGKKHEEKLTEEKLNEGTFKLGFTIEINGKMALLAVTVGFLAILIVLAGSRVAALAYLAKRSSSDSFSSRQSCTAVGIEHCDGRTPIFPGASVSSIL